jgi:prepilin-type N-terminal cleavage/methylation domain-containing protein
VSAVQRTRHSRGFSLVELIVVAAVVAVGAAVAVVSLARVSSTASARESFVDTAAAAKRAAASAVGGRATTFSAERDGRVARGMTVNPKYVPAPPGTEAADEIEFEGGTGNARIGGQRAVASIVMAEEGRRDFAYAVVAGTAGRIELLTYADGVWRPFQ